MLKRELYLIGAMLPDGPYLFKTNVQFIALLLCAL